MQKFSIKLYIFLSFYFECSVYVSSNVPAHAAAHAPAHASAQAAAIAYADVTLKLPFRPSSRSCAGSRCHCYFFVRLTICLYVRPSVRLYPTDSLSVQQTVSPFAVRQSVSPSVCQSVSLYTRSSVSRPSVNCQSVRQPSVRQLPSVRQPLSVRQPSSSVNRFYWGGGKKKKHTTQEI